jgi:hypothetical protein
MSDVKHDFTEAPIPPPPPIDPTPHDPPEPVPMPVDVMTPEKMARMAELKRMQALAPLDEAAAAELAALEASPLPPGPDPEEVKRLAELRAAESRGLIADADKAELDKLALMEADAAGHVRPEAVVAEPLDPVHSMLGDVIAMLEGMVDSVPALAGMRGAIFRLKVAHNRLIAPPPEPKP